MSTEIPDLWADDISVDVLSPQVILKVQAENLSRKTHGVLLGEVSTPKSSVRSKQIDFEVVAPAIRRRIRILTARHNDNDPYPVLVSSPPLATERNSLGGMAAIYDRFGVLSAEEQESSSVAETQEEMLGLIAKVLQSLWLKSRLQSLIALSNETTEKPA